MGDYIGGGVVDPTITLYKYLIEDLSFVELQFALKGYSRINDPPNKCSIYINVTLHNLCLMQYRLR